MEPIEVKVKKLRPNAQLPYQADSGSVGFDLRTDLFDEETQLTVLKTVLLPNQQAKIHTGIAVEIPENHFMMIFPRSSMGVKKNLILKNTVGIIDSSYRGEILLFVKNIGDTPIEIDNGERIAQAVVIPYPAISYVESDTLSETSRGDGGFGSTNFDKFGNKIL